MLNEEMSIRDEVSAARAGEDSEEGQPEPYFVCSAVFCGQMETEGRGGKDGIQFSGMSEMLYGGSDPPVRLRQGWFVHPVQGMGMYESGVWVQCEDR